jgi:hypothetical protein
LVKKYNLDPLKQSKWNILYETIEYREFLEYAFEKRKPLDEFSGVGLKRVKNKVFTDLKDLARHQINFLPKFRSKNVVNSWREARQLVDDFVIKSTC